MKQIRLGRIAVDLRGGKRGTVLQFRKQAHIGKVGAGAFVARHLWYRFYAVKGQV